MVIGPVNVKYILVCCIWRHDYFTAIFKPVVLEERLWPLLVVLLVAASEPAPACMSLGRLKPDTALWSQRCLRCVVGPRQAGGQEEGRSPLNGEMLKQPFEMACILFGTERVSFVSLNAAHLPGDLQGQ